MTPPRPDTPEHHLTTLDRRLAALEAAALVLDQQVRASQRALRCAVVGLAGGLLALALLAYAVVRLARAAG